MQISQLTNLVQSMHLAFQAARVFNALFWLPVLKKRFHKSFHPELNIRRVSEGSNKYASCYRIASAVPVIAPQLLALALFRQGVFKTLNCFGFLFVARETGFEVVENMFIGFLYCAGEFFYAPCPLTAGQEGKWMQSCIPITLSGKYS
jgi:hypothetical protein